MSSSSSCLHTNAYAYAYAQLPKASFGFIAVYASITTNSVKLRCEPTSTFDSHSAAWARTNKSDNQKWAQAGYTRARFPGTFLPKWGIYLEVKAGPLSTDYYFKLGSAPGSGTNNYAVELAPSIGQWVASYNATPWSSFTHSGWINDSGDLAQWSGEIYVTESHMVGTVASKCQFSALYYTDSSGSTHSTNLTASNLSGTNFNYWSWQYVSPTAFNIWDVIPLP